MSDWFTREDGQTSAVVVKKPNPKNVQNVAKIKELEEKIQRYVRAVILAFYDQYYRDKN